ncbi:hypothetical protein KJ951_04780, partial [Patescibacteria group bacterium]|nr:hypothetical protein [Patescibacteria group bacterium]
MKITLKASINPRNSLLIIPLFEDEDIAKLLPKQLASFAGILKKEKDFKGKQGQTFALTPLSEKLPGQVLFLGMGKENKIDGTAARVAAANATSLARHHHAGTLAFFLQPAFKKYQQELA